MQQNIKFGVSGNSLKFFESGLKHTIEAPSYLNKLGLDAYEISFGRGITLGDDKAIEISQECKKNNIDVSVHAPYYINLANPSQDMIDKSFMYIINCCKKVNLLGGNRVVVHSGTQGKMSYANAFELVKQRLKVLTQLIYDNSLQNNLICLETMGKSSQIGTAEEVIELCSIDNIYIPTLDFGHIYARSLGKLNTYDDYVKILENMLTKLGERSKRLHIHFSKIEFGKFGEIRHLTFDNSTYGPEFEPLAKALKCLDLSPTIMCESAGTQDIDACTMKKIYNNI
ncbi:MAG: TIM barrel protein [Clostridia bacterium]